MLNKKKLIEIISYIIFVVVKYCNGRDDFLLVNKYERAKYYCITNSSSALSWILDDTASNANLTQESVFLPTSENLLKITCSTIKEPCQESFANSITLDRRWEKFPTYKTDYVEDGRNHYSPLKLTTVEQALKNNFVVPLSVRTSQEAHLFLCEGNNITTSNCYWLIIDGFQRTRRGIRKCPENTIPSLKHKRINGSCATLKMEHSYTSPQRSSSQKWKHFKLTKINTWITLTNLNGEILISFNDTEKAFNVKYMIMHVKYTSGLWKIHKLKYFNFTEEGQLWQQEVKPIQDVVCISAFIKMCDSCSILLEIKNEKMPNKHLGSETYKLQALDWKEIKFIKTDIKTKNVILTFTAISSQKENTFWAIDGIYQCAKDGFRMITLNQNASCQILSSDSKTVTINNKLNISSDDLDECTEHTIGKFCIPCQLFLNEDCGKLKFCEFHNNRHLCSCSAGYQVNNSGFCNSRCENGKYGWKCRKRCSKNCVGCNNIDGTCQSCRNTNKGVMCDQRRSQKPNGLTVQWSLKNDLLIKWKHPTEAMNGDIHFFEINILPPANYPSHEIRYNHTVDKEKYLPIYTHTVPANDLLNSVEYEIRVRAINDLYIEISDHKEWSPPEIPLFESEPNLISSNGTIIIKTSKIKLMNSKNKYKLFLLLSDDTKNRSLSTTFQNLENSFNIQLPTFRILYECDEYAYATEFIIGKANYSASKCKNNDNLFLTPATNYNITILLVNDDGRKKSYKFYSYEILTEGEIQIPSKLLALLLLLLLIPIITIIIFFKRKTVLGNTPGKSIDEEIPLTVAANFPTNNLSQLQGRNSPRYYSHDHLNKSKIN